MTCGIYKLNFVGTEKVYIGQSLNCESRLTRHIREMRNNTNSLKLNKALKEFGEPSLQILITCDKSELDDLENINITKYNAVDNGFNTAYYAAGGCSLSGECHPLATVSNAYIIEVLEYILDNPRKTLSEVSIELNVSFSIVSHIFKGDRHTWVHNQYPELWARILELQKLKSRGEYKGTSKCSDSSIALVMSIIVNCPDITYKEISEFTGVPLDSINSLTKGSSFKWLADISPEEYRELMSLKGTRSRHKQVGGTMSAKARGITYPILISPGSIKYEVTNVSAFAREHRLDKSTIHRVLTYKADRHKGWKRCQEEQVL